MKINNSLNLIYVEFGRVFGKLGTLPIFPVANPYFDRIINAMPRIARIIAAGYPHHITQRGNNRITVFFDDEDRQMYLKLLSGYAQRYHL
ncbi:hypothetical protein KJB30_04940, partial [Geobacter chapellei]|nr:hypothetical protein [Pelotalea chapellei]